MAGPSNSTNSTTSPGVPVSVWIGEIQWMRRNGFSGTRNPILKPLDTIECRNAILTPDGIEPEWPEADVVIGNPPFLGTKLQIRQLGEEYVSRLRSTYTKRVLARAALVCYWFEKAGRLHRERLQGPGSLRPTPSEEAGTCRPCNLQLTDIRSSRHGVTNHGSMTAPQSECL